MLDRASTFSDERVIELLKTRFVPVALDVWYEERRADPAGDLYRKIVFQREGTSPEKTTQGFYICASDGRLLQEETALPVHVAEDPLSAVAEGAGRVLGEIEFLRKVSTSD